MALAHGHQGLAEVESAYRSAKAADLGAAGLACPRGTVAAQQDWEPHQERRELQAGKLLWTVPVLRTLLQTGPTLGTVLAWLRAWILQKLARRTRWGPAALGPVGPALPWLQALGAEPPAQEMPVRWDACWRPVAHCPHPLASEPVDRSSAWKRSPSWQLAREPELTVLLLEGQSLAMLVPARLVLRPQLAWRRALPSVSLRQRAPWVPRLRERLLPWWQLALGSLPPLPLPPWPSKISTHQRLPLRSSSWSFRPPAVVPGSDPRAWPSVGPGPRRLHRARKSDS